MHDKKAYIDQAKREYEDNDIEIDHDAAVEKVDNGAWVQAWVWVYDSELN